jgi:hypothetical protein
MKLNIFSKLPSSGKYKGVSDFMINAPSEKKIKVFTEITRRATTEQKKVLDRTGITLKGC